MLSNQYQLSLVVYMISHSSPVGIQDNARTAFPPRVKASNNARTALKASEKTSSAIECSLDTGKRPPCQAYEQCKIVALTSERSSSSSATYSSYTTPLSLPPIPR